MNLEELGERLEAVHAELGREHLETRAGLGADSHLADILERHRDLAERTLLTGLLRRLAGGTADVATQRRLRILLEPLATFHADYRQREIHQQIEDLAATLTAIVDGETVRYRDLPARARAATGRDRRRAHHRALLDLVAGPLRPLHRERVMRARRTALDLGYPDYVEFIAATSGFDPVSAAGALEPVLVRTEAEIRSLFGEAIRRSIGEAGAESHDIRAILRAPAFDAWFPAGGEAALASTIVERGLGLDLTAGGRLRFDIGPRPGKALRAVSVAVHVPDEVHLVATPRAGVEAYADFFHELGRALHQAHVDRALPVEARRFGDRSVSEAFAALIEGVLRERAWAERHLGSELEGYLEHAALHDIWTIRRTTSKLSYELELWRAPESEIDRLEARYVAHLEAAAPLPADGELYLADLDLHLAAARRLRGRLLAAVLHQRLRSDFGDAWFTSRRAGRLLREIWASGQRYDADELARELGYESLSADPLLEEVSTR